MKVTYLLGLIAAISTTQSAFATTFTIVDHTTLKISGTKINIDSIAPLYKDSKPVFKMVEPVTYRQEIKDDTFVKSTSNHSAQGIKGSSGLYHLKGVTFKIGNKTYEARFKAEEEPGRLDRNVLIRILGGGNSKDATYSGKYECYLYTNSLNCDAPLYDINFTEVKN